MGTIIGEARRNRAIGHTAPDREEHKIATAATAE
jgi:hypothetical protein